MSDRIPNKQGTRKGKRLVVFIIALAAIVIAGVVTILAVKGKPAPQQPFGVRFYLQENENGFIFTNAKLHAVVDGADYLVDLEAPADGPLCILLEDTIDVDGDGDKEALVRNIQACGGNAQGDCFFIVKYTGDGHFSISKNMGDDAGDIETELWKGGISFVVSNNLDNDRYEKLRYVYKNGQVKLVETKTIAL